MPLPGGPANKIGNRYERLWTVYQLLRVIDGEFESIRLEEPGDDKAEFVMRRGDKEEYHQAKRSGIRGKWSIADLTSEGVLNSISEFLALPQSSYVFASGCAANELRELCEAAASAESEDEFKEAFLKANSRRNSFERIQNTWKCKSSTVIHHLRRIRVETVGERELEEFVGIYSRTLFLTRADAVVSKLLRLIDDSIHKTVRRNELLEELTESGFLLRRVKDRSVAVLAVQQLTDQYLQAAKRKLIHRTLVPRTASKLVLDEVGNSATALVGKAGCGKSACTVEIIEGLLEQQTTVLALRLDTHVRALNTRELGNRLGFEESPVLMLAEAAQKTGSRGVLIVDQLDAVSAMSGRSSDALDLVERLLEEIVAMRNRVDLHFVVVCRLFDWDNDHRLRGLIQDDDRCVPVDEFTNEEARQLLLNGGFTPSLFRDAQLRLLRVPQNLSLFLASDFDKSSVPNFNTVTELFDLYWNAKRESVEERSNSSAEHWSETLQLLCSEMTSNQELSVRREVLDGISGTYLNQMASEGVLVLESKRYSFGHESFFDYCYARVLFLPSSESLNSMLRASEQHLFRRGQVRQVLTYIRDVDFKRYIKELRTLLADQEIRIHIKDLVFALLAEVLNPREEEWEIWREYTDPALEALKSGSSLESTLSGLAWQRLIVSKPWFEYLVSNGVVDLWLQSDNDALINLIAERYLRIHQEHNPNTVARLLEPYASHSGEWRERLKTFMTWADVSGSRRLFDLFLHLIDNGTLDDAKGPIAVNSTFWDLIHDLDKKRPDWVGEVIAHRIERRFTLSTKAGGQLLRNELLGDRSAVGGMFSNASQSAPLAFVCNVLPTILHVSDATASGTAPRRDPFWTFRFKTAYPSLERAAFDALTDAIEKLAESDIDKFTDCVLQELSVRDTYAANHLLLAIYRACPDRYGNEAANKLCAEPWRFDCGYTDSGYWFAMQTISRIGPYLSQDILNKFENSILQFLPRNEMHFEARKWRYSAQFALLSALPSEYRSETWNKRFQELERKFSELPREPKEMQASIVESPINPARLKKMSDAQWLSALERYANDDWRTEGRGIVGGVHQLSQALKEEVKNEPERFARLAMRFDSKINESYLQSTLAGLSQVNLDDGLKLDVCRKAFSESREFCSREIADAIGSVEGTLPEDGFCMLDWLATEHPEPVNEPWKVQAGAGYDDVAREVYTQGINTTQGRAALSMQKLILASASHVDRFRKTLEKMLADSNTAVLSCAASMFDAIALTNPEEAIELFLTMSVPEDELLSTPHVFNFMKNSLPMHFEKLNPLIKRMLSSNVDEVATHGAILSGLSLLHGHASEELVEAALSSGKATRLGIAKVASANIKTREFRNWCETWLLQMFEDEVAEVRIEVASCFRNLQDEPLEQYEVLIDKFSSSPAFDDDSWTILSVLNESRARLPGLTCLVCERHLGQFSDEARDIRRARARDTYILNKLVFRTYQQHQDDEWSSRSLDLIDLLCIESYYGTSEQFDKFER